MKNRIALLAFAALALPATAAAQQTAPAAPQPAAPAQAAPAAPAQSEVTQIQQRLAALQQQAVQDPAVKAHSDALETALAAALAQVDPAATGKLARVEALKAEVEAARAASDNAKLNQLAAEATELQAYFQQLRPRAMALPEVQEKRQAYVAALFAKMNEIDPQAQALVARLEALRNGTAGGQQ